MKNILPVHFQPGLCSTLLGCITLLHWCEWDRTWEPCRISARFPEWSCMSHFIFGALFLSPFSSRISVVLSQLYGEQQNHFGRAVGDDIYCSQEAWKKIFLFNCSVNFTLKVLMLPLLFNSLSQAICVMSKEFIFSLFSHFFNTYFFLNGAAAEGKKK